MLDFGPEFSTVAGGLAGGLVGFIIGGLKGVGDGIDDHFYFGVMNYDDKMDLFKKLLYNNKAPEKIANNYIYQ